MAKIRGFHAEILKDRYRKVLEDKGYKFFDNELPYNVNIIGIRNMEGRVNQFDDIILVIYRDSYKRWIVDSYQVTTDPGLYWLKKPMRVEGCAILVPNQYRGAYKIDKHGGKYDALCQRGAELTIWRDNDRDSKHDMKGELHSGWYGINIHKAGKDSSIVNKWSAGCQVFKNSSDFSQFMDTMRQAEKRFGNSFSYTLIESTDVGE
tara:strand:+ start:3516 stop:4133 length:618 start_codon:yes stop_codon:yes gene_type:complete